MTQNATSLAIKPTGLLDNIGLIGMDHLAVTTPDLKATLADYLTMQGAQLIKGPGLNPTQRVEYAFVRLATGLVVEILGVPPEGRSPIEGHLVRGGGAYHVCYVVADLEAALAHVRACGGLIVVKPVADVAFEGRRIAFFRHRLHGLVELVEQG